MDGCGARWFSLFAHPGTLRLLEKITAGALIAVTSLHLALNFQAMSSSSLWTDELGSIADYSSKGPRHVMTDYTLPRNHIFYSLLDSMLPAAGSFDAMRARALSFGFAALLAAAIVGWFFRRQQYFEGGVMFALWGLNGELLQLSLQARGYGLLCLLTFALCVLTLKACESGRARDFGPVGFCVILGTYTSPNYLLFAAPLLLLLFAPWRDRIRLLIGLGTACAIMALYAPVAGQMFVAMKTYGEKYGHFYASAAALFDTLKSYAWPFEDWLVLLLLLALTAAPFVLWPAGTPLGRAVKILLSATFLFLAFCLKLKTAPIRTTCFVGIVLAFGSVQILGALRLRLRRDFQVLTVCLTCVGGLLSARAVLAHFHFAPYEDWRRVARFLETMFPRGTVVDFSHNAQSITYYLNQKNYRLYFSKDRELLQEPFLRGEIPVLVAPWKYATEPRLHARTFGPRGLEAVAPGKIRDIAVNFMLPENRHCALVKLEATPGGGGRSLHVSLTPEPRYHSLNWILRAAALDFARPILVVHGSATREVKATEIESVGRVCALPLGDAAVTDVFVPASENATVDDAEFWANPAR